MKKIFYAIIGIALIITALVVLSSESKSEKTVVYHITLADPKLYTDGIFTDTFKIQNGTYQFSFVPNGDSPQIMSIQLKGESFSLSRDFKLVGTPHNTGISTYYTWDYDGEKELEILEDVELEITINPHENLLGSVSVDIIKR